MIVALHRDSRDLSRGGCRDLKPSNFLVQRHSHDDVRVVLADFGEAVFYKDGTDVLIKSNITVDSDAVVPVTLLTLLFEHALCSASHGRSDGWCYRLAFLPAA